MEARTMKDEQFKALLDRLDKMLHGTDTGFLGFEAIAYALAGEGLEYPVGEQLVRIAEQLERLADAVEKQQEEY